MIQNTMLVKTLYNLSRRSALFWPRFVSALCLSVMISNAQASEINVAVSLRPLHGLVQMVLGQTGEATLLAGDAAHPENIILYPSDHWHLNNADIVFIINPKFEVNIFKSLKNNNKIVFLSEAEGVSLMKRRIAGLFGHHADVKSVETPDHDHNNQRHDDHNHGHDHAFGEMDYHIWLNPDHAIAMVAQIEKRLSQTYPVHAKTFKLNAQFAKQSIIDLDKDITAILKTIKPKGFLVYQDAYLYFETAYDFNVTASLLDHHNSGTDVKRIKALRHLTSTGQVSCIMSEPQFDQKLLTLIDPEGKLAHTITDPYGFNQTIGTDLYSNLMIDLAHRFAHCKQ